VTTHLQDLVHLIEVFANMILFNFVLQVMFTPLTLRQSDESEEHYRRRTSTVLHPQIRSALTVAGILVFDLFVVWTLAKMKSPLGADVSITFKKFGADVVVTSAGLLGAFLAIAIVTLTATHGFYGKN
jgi:hypothetical protein